MIGGDKDPAERARAQLRRLFAQDDEALSGARTWAADVLDQAGLDPSAAPLRSLRALRRAEARLSPVAARHLVDALRGTGGRTRGRRPLPPHLE